VQEITIPKVSQSNGDPCVTEAGDDCKVELFTSIFNHTRGKQEEAIDVIREGKNCLLVLPTGAGKPICFAIPALYIIFCVLLQKVLPPQMWKKFSKTFLNMEIKEHFLRLKSSAFHSNSDI